MWSGGYPVERGGCSDNWNVVEVQSRYRPVLCNAVAHTTCTIHRVATQSILSVATQWYSMCGCALVWYGIRWYIMGGSTWWYILIAFVSSGMVECGLVKTMVWVSVLSGNTTNSYQLKAGYWMTITIKSRFLGGVLVWHCSQRISGIDQRILIWWHQMKIWVFIADNWTTLTSCWLSKDLTKAREMRRWGSKD